MNENILNLLKDIGLTQREAEVYIALLKMGKSSVLDISKNVKIHRTNIYDNLENLYANLGVDYNVGDLDLGFTSGISSQDKKKLIANIGLNKDFESGLGSGILTPSLSYDILNKEPKLDIGYQHEFDETIPYVGDGTLKIGGEFDKEGKNLGITFKKKFAEGGRVSFTKGGLANILKV